MIISQPSSGIPESNLTTRGDIIRRGAAASERLALGTTSHVLMSDGTDTVTGQIVDASVAAGAAIADAKLSIAGQAGEGHILLLPFNYNSVIAGTWVIVVGDTYWFNGFIWNSTHADGDGLLFKVYLAAGTYTVRLMATTQNVGGIVDVKFGDSAIASFDLYSAGYVKNTIFSDTGNVVAASGIEDISVLLNGKHGSSTDYLAEWQMLALWRTA